MNQQRTVVYGYTSGQGASERFNKYIQNGPKVRWGDDEGRESD